DEKGEAAIGILHLTISFLSHLSIYPFSLRPVLYREIKIDPSLVSTSLISGHRVIRRFSCRSPSPCRCRGSRRGAGVYGKSRTAVPRLGAQYQCRYRARQNTSRALLVSLPHALEVARCYETSGHYR